MKMGMLGILLFSVTTASNSANNPASTDYVDRQIAAARASLTALISTAGVAHPIGSCFGGGVVFYVNTTPGAAVGQRGLIAALADAGVGLTWGQTSQDVVGTSKKYFTGQANTTTILAASGSHQAAASANTYTTVETCTDCTPWYLPSQEELMTLFAQADSSGATFWTQCGGTAPSLIQYWSSTQDQNVDRAWVVHLGSSSGGLVNDELKSNLRAVRAIRAF